MGVDLDSRPDATSDDLNPGQKHADEMFSDDLSQARKQENDGDTPSDETTDSEKSLFNKDDAAAGAAGASAGAAGLVKALNGNPIGKLSVAKEFFWGSAKRKAATSGGGIAGLVIGLFSVGSMFLAGPLELIHIAQNLEQWHMSDQENAEDGRMGRAYRYFKKGMDPGETRIGWIGSNMKDKFLDDFKQMGMEPEFGAGKNYKGMTIDTTNENWEGKSPDEIKGQLTEAGISESDIVIDHDKGTVHIKDNKGMFSKTKNLNILRKMTGTQKGLMGKLRMRQFKKYGWVTWHPLAPLDKKVNQKLSDVIKEFRDKKAANYKEGMESMDINAEDSSTEEESTDKDGNKTTTDTATSDADKATAAGEAGNANEMESRFKSFGTTGKVVGGIAAVQGIICGMKGIADGIDQVRQTQVVIPLIRMGSDVLSSASQVQSGEDFNTTTLEALSKSWDDVDETSGKTVSTWDQSQSVQGEQGKSGGIEPSKTLDGIAQGIPGWLSWTQNGIIGKFCSKVAQIAGGVISLFLGAISGGLVSAVTGVVTGAVAGHFVGKAIDAVIKMMAGDTINTLASGAEWGNDVNYGSRMFSNATAAEMGGVGLSDQEAAALKTDSDAANQADFASHSIAYRLFNPNDSRTMAAAAVDNSTAIQPQNLPRTVGSLVASFGSIVKLPLTMFFGSKVSADAQPYNYGFPEYGFSEQDLNDPRFQDPYDNANKAAKILDNNSGYIDRAFKCFGVNITKGGQGWQVVPASSTGDDPTKFLALYSQNSDQYPKGDCQDRSEDWLRIRFFILDSGTLDGWACLKGDSTGCQNDGVDPAPTTASAGSATIAAFNMCQEENHPFGNGNGNCPASTGPESNKVAIVSSAILGQSGLGNQPFDIITGVEVSQPTQAGILKRLPNYASYPEKVSRNNGYAVFWNNDKFEEVTDGDLSDVTGNSGIHLDGDTDGGSHAPGFPWVELRDRSTQHLFYVMSIHSPNDTFGGAADRISNAKKFMAWAQSHSSDGATIIIGGDFNNGDQTDGGQPSAYCIMTSGGMLQHVLDMQNNKNANKACPTDHIAIDQLYVSATQGITAANWGHNENPEKGGTDHGPSWSTISYPGTDGTAAGNVSYSNPIIKGNHPDPAVIRGDDGKFYMYTTGGTASNPFQAYTSKDMVHWTASNSKTIKDPPGWLSAERWAPDVTKTGDHYTMTFSGGGYGLSCDSSHYRRIGYATASTPDGPFTYQGVLVENKSACGYAIDPDLEQINGKLILYYGSGSSISAAPITMNGNKLSVGASKVVLKKNSSESTLTEGSWVIERNGWYYLFYSTGKWNSKSGSTEYQTNVARSKDPYNFKDREVLLTGGNGFEAPGHNTVVTDDQGTDWIIYHAYQGSDNDRNVMLDKITYTTDGWPKVNDGHPSKGQQTGPYINGAGSSATASLGGAPGKSFVGADGFTSGWCTDYVKYILARHSSKYSSGSLGDGKDVANSLGKLGYTVNHTPAVHAVVSFPGPPYGNVGDHYAGHVALVGQVNSDGSIVVEESNFNNPMHYGTHTVSASEAKTLTYAHTEVGWH